MSATVSALLLIAGLGICARLLIVHATRREESEAEKRIRSLLADEMQASEVDTPDEPARRGLFGRRRKRGEISPSVRRVATWLEGTRAFQDDEGRDFIAKIDQELILAGLERKYSAFDALAITLMCWLIGVAGLTFLYFEGIIPKFLYVIAVPLAAAYPFLKLRSLKANRADSIRAEVIMFIMQLRMAVSSGMTTLDEALTRIARQAEIDPYDSILAQEFGRAMNQVRVGGMEWEPAMRQVSQRTGVLSVDTLVEALIQARRMGTDLTQMLAEYGRAATEMWQQDMRAVKARKEPKITIGMIITLFGGFLLIAGPMMIGLMDTMSIVSGGGR